MNKNDWVGLATSLTVHGLLLFLFGFMTIAAAKQETLGFIEVDLGPISQGRPVQRAVETRPEVAERRPPAPTPQPQQRAAPPREAKPVELPKEAPTESEEVVQAPDTDRISPQQQNNPADVTRPEQQPEQRPVQPLGGGSADGTTGSADGASGDAADETKAAPYLIEGLNRNPISAPLPNYAEKVNATIRVRITVDPQGAIVQRVPLLKANPALEQAVMSALQRWRFNPLPANVPQENQIGIVTFRFVLQ
jgi:periplasmic protein TonB